MITCGRLQRQAFCVLLAVNLTLAAAGCSKVPRHYVRMAELDATLTDLVAHPEKYDGKVVMLGGTLIEEEANEQYIWLRLKNRPLDQDYMPNRPADLSGSEAGSYWVAVEKNQLPQTYREWARTRQTIIAMEQGKYSPSLELAFRVALAFGVPLEQVFSYDPETESS